MLSQALSRTLRTVTLIAAGAVTLALASTGMVHAEPIRNVVLVHGAYADGSSWSEVIPRLQKAGL